MSAGRGADTIRTMAEHPAQGTRGPTADGNDRAAAIRRAARAQWNRDPAGAIALGPECLGTPESFARIEHHRYTEQPWMHTTFGYDRFRGQRVLEIGVGLGTDHIQFARAGAQMTGIDLTPRCIELTRQRFLHEKLASELLVMDAERLEFADNSFDVVYAFGVLHHLPSPERAFAEVRRVLRPGGVFMGAVYNRWSLFIATTAFTWLRTGEWRRESFEGRISRIEHSTANQRPGPYVRLFSRRQLRHALRDAGFREIHVVRRHFGLILNRQLPRWLVAETERLAGWYLVHRAS